MAIDRNHNEERRARLDAMIEEFRAAQQRQLVQRGIVLWTRAEAALQARTYIAPAPADKVH